MLFISKEGHVDSDRIVVRIYPRIERGPMHKVNGIVVHQTAAPTASSTFSSYQVNGANGAHFLIDRDGTIYQTASLRKRTNHVGNIKSRCLETRKCSPAEFNAAYPLKWRPTPLSRHEHRKPFPERYPGNTDSVGIELVGAYIEKNEVYESVTPSQNDAVRWLVAELSATLKVAMGDVYRHPQLSRKTESEASSAKW
ncbi:MULTISPECIES: peptidoglycan recognition protein family protein [Cupriavidus]|jgi:N-acetyl-anhydromuramyl-L-alanine amidase AmpD|uniref:peptidoglycan recognition protein family protein n=1 Tax=unclassified Cupriavidus TaxID=2640874 RepID=UPI000B808C9D|nr:MULTISPECIES: peptidoglycan recognition family protein [unclassified Cupriavidus]